MANCDMHSLNLLLPGALRQERSVRELIPRNLQDSEYAFWRLGQHNSQL